MTDPVRDDMSSKTGSLSHPAPRGSASRFRSETVALSLIVLVVVDNHRATLDPLVVYNHSVATFLAFGGVGTGRSRREYCVLGRMPFEIFKSLKIIFFKKVGGFRPTRHVVQDGLSQSLRSPSLVPRSWSLRSPWSANRFGSPSGVPCISKIH